MGARVVYWLGFRLFTILAKVQMVSPARPGKTYPGSEGAPQWSVAGYKKQPIPGLVLADQYIKNGIRFFNSTSIFFLSPQALKLDWITLLIHILCLYHHVLATRLGHWSTNESCDDVLQMVAPVVGYRAVSPGGWVGNSTRVGFRIFTISDVRSSFGKHSSGWVGNSTRVGLRFFYNFQLRFRWHHHHCGEWPLPYPKTNIFDVINMFLRLLQIFF